MFIEARLVVFLSSASHKNKPPITLGLLTASEPSVDDAIRTLCSSADNFHPSGFVYDCTLWTDTRFPSFRTATAEAGVRLEFEQIGLDSVRS